MPSTPLTPEDILKALQAAVPGAEAHPQPVKPYATFKVPAARWRDAAAALKDKLGFAYLDMIASIDWKGPVKLEGFVKDPNPNPFLADATPETDQPTATPGVNYREAFEVVAIFSNLESKTKVAMKAELPRQEPKVASLSSLFKAADWQEREAYDLMGIAFEGHPHLAKILTPDYMEGHPLRKDYVHVKDRYD